ncbi:hypothetical protein C8F01DRAFT_1091403 [Mycena amicta]|nr:hypothetical protein C8F01DRAFT_1091403 [Mycena amicta]
MAGLKFSTQSGASAPGSPDSCPFNLIGTPPVVSTSPRSKPLATSRTSSVAATLLVPATTVTTGTSAGTPTTGHADTSAGIAASSSVSPPSTAGSPVETVSAPQPESTTKLSDRSILTIALGLGLSATFAMSFALLFIRQQRKRRRNLANFLPVPFPAASILEKPAARASRTSSQPMVEQLEAHRAAQVALERQNTTLQQQVQMLEVELQLHRDPDMDGSPPEYVDSTSRAGDG